jgi:PAS domain S-box-containing protein
MSFDLNELFLIGVTYLSVLFGIAFIADKGWIPERFIRHPFVFVLSLGVIASSWSFYGMVDVAQHYGFGFLAYFFGLSVPFLFASMLIVPLQRISRMYQLSSMADLLTFRYRSQWAGILVTLFMVLAMLPLLALQIAVVSDSLQILSGGQSVDLFAEGGQSGLAFTFCCVILLFTILFGSRHIGTRERHNGLVSAIAFESLSKLAALLFIGFVVGYKVFEGPEGMEAWLALSPQQLSQLNNSFESQDVRYLLLMFFTSAVAMPHLFHMLFSERPNNRALRVASWAFPSYLLLLSLPILPILWGATKLGSTMPADYYVLDIGILLESRSTAIIAFLGGLSAASGTIIVSTIALASMCLNHLVLAVYQPDTTQNIYRWLQWIRQIIISGIVLLAYLFFRVLDNQQQIADLGIAAFAGILQIVPGFLAILYWPGANRNGFIAGLAAGMFSWGLLVLTPLLMPGMLPQIDAWLQAQSLGMAQWQTGTLLSLCINISFFVIGSALTETSDEERAAAEICSTDDLSRPLRQTLDVHSPKEMKARLAEALGKSTATREVNNALADLNFDREENRPYALRRLRDRVEANLSGLLGPSIAHEIINRYLPYTQPGSSLHNEDINFIEQKLEGHQNQLTGLAAELDNLRRYHRQTLHNLPIGVCIVGADKELLMWNMAMEALTGIQSDDIVGSSLNALGEPWYSVINEFSQSQSTHIYKQHIVDHGEDRWISLHKTHMHFDNLPTTDVAILIEDLTDTQMLEQELTHSERLASVGRLAAGVAHEIGNPITGIACLAQNLEYDNTPEEIRTTAADILQQTERVTTIVQSLVSFSHAGSHSTAREFAAVDIGNCADDAIRLLQLDSRARQVNFINECESGLEVLGNEQQLVQIFVNLLSNARDASSDYADIRVRSEQDQYSVEVCVEDQGDGIPQEILEQVFDPFFTTKDPGEGTGLGLAMVYNIVEEHSGQISIDSPLQNESPFGTRVAIRLPKFAPESGI